MPMYTFPGGTAIGWSSGPCMVPGVKDCTRCSLHGKCHEAEEAKRQKFRWEGSAYPQHIPFILEYLRYQHGGSSNFSAKHSECSQGESRSFSTWHSEYPQGNSCSVSIRRSEYPQENSCSVSTGRIGCSQYISHSCSMHAENPAYPQHDFWCSSRYPGFSAAQEMQDMYGKNSFHQPHGSETHESTI